MFQDKNDYYQKFTEHIKEVEFFHEIFEGKYGKNSCDYCRKFIWKNIFESHRTTLEHIY